MVEQQRFYTPTVFDDGDAATDTSVLDSESAYHTPLSFVQPGPPTPMTSIKPNIQSVGAAQKPWAWAISRTPINLVKPGPPTPMTALGPQTPIRWTKPGPPTPFSSVGLTPRTNLDVSGLGVGVPPSAIRTPLAPVYGSPSKMSGLRSRRVQPSTPSNLKQVTSVVLSDVRARRLERESRLVELKKRREVRSRENSPIRTPRRASSAATTPLRDQTPIRSPGTFSPATSVAVPGSPSAIVNRVTPVTHDIRAAESPKLIISRVVDSVDPPNTAFLFPPVDSGADTSNAVATSEVVPVSSPSLCVAEQDNINEHEKVIAGENRIGSSFDRNARSEGKKDDHVNTCEQSPTSKDTTVRAEDITEETEEVHQNLSSTEIFPDLPISENVDQGQSSENCEHDICETLDITKDSNNVDHRQVNENLKCRNLDLSGARVDISTDSNDSDGELPPTPNSTSSQNASGVGSVETSTPIKRNPKARPHSDAQTVLFTIDEPAVNNSSGSVADVASLQTKIEENSAGDLSAWNNTTAVSSLDRSLVEESLNKSWMRHAELSNMVHDLATRSMNMSEAPLEELATRHQQLSESISVLADQSIISQADSDFQMTLKADVIQVQYRLCTDSNGSFGFTLNVGVSGDPGVLIKATSTGGSAFVAGILPLDRVIRINGILVDGIGPDRVFEALQANSDICDITLIRRNRFPIESRIPSLPCTTIVDTQLDTRDTSFELLANPQNGRGPIVSTTGNDKLTHWGIRDGDEIVAVDGLVVSDFSSVHILGLLEASEQEAQIRLYRPDPEPEFEVDVGFEVVKTTLREVDQKLSFKLIHISNRGAVVSWIEDGGSADKAGIRENDAVLAVNGALVEVTSSVDIEKVMNCPGINIIHLKRQCEVDRMDDGESCASLDETKLETDLDDIALDDSDRKSNADEEMTEICPEEEIMIVRTNGSYGFRLRDGGSERGLSVSNVVPNGPAYQGGLEVGDQIVAVGGQPVAGKSITDVFTDIRCGPDTLSLSIRRENGFTHTPQGYYTKEVVVTRSGGSIDLGFEVECTPDEPERGVTIEWISAGSPAATCGLRVDDRIVAINDTRTDCASFETVDRLITADPSADVRFFVRRKIEQPVSLDFMETTSFSPPPKSSAPRRPKPLDASLLSIVDDSPSKSSRRSSVADAMKLLERVTPKKSGLTSLHSMPPLTPYWDRKVYPAPKFVTSDVTSLLETQTSEQLAAEEDARDRIDEFQTAFLQAGGDITHHSVIGKLRRLQQSVLNSVKLRRRHDRECNEVLRHGSHRPSAMVRAAALTRLDFLPATDKERVTIKSLLIEPSIRANLKEAVHGISLLEDKHSRYLTDNVIEFIAGCWVPLTREGDAVLGHIANEIAADNSTE